MPELPCVDVTFLLGARKVSEQSSTNFVKSAESDAAWLSRALALRRGCRGRDTSRLAESLGDAFSCAAVAAVHGGCRPAGRLRLGVLAVRVGHAGGVALVLVVCDARAIAPVARSRGGEPAPHLGSAAGRRQSHHVVVAGAGNGVAVAADDAGGHIRTRSRV